MTFRDVVTATLRRWYVPLFILCAAAAVTMPLVKSGGLYTARTVVMFINLRSELVPIGPDNGSENENIIAFAGAVANDINNGRAVVRYARDDAPLYGAGTSQGVFVGLRDDGGQWMTSFTRAELEIEIVGSTYEYVESMQRDLLVRVFERTRELQGPTYNDPERRIRTQVLPLTLAIEHVTASRSQLVMAWASMSAAAMIVGIWGAVRLDALIRERPTKGDKAPNQGGQDDGAN